MRLLFLGDIVGRAGRAAVAEHLPILSALLKPDAVIINAENAAAGFGLTRKIADDLFALGADCLTTGNHVWDQREMIQTIGADKRILRPVNYPPDQPGQGAVKLSLAAGQILVINVMLRLFMDPLDDPFRAVDRIIADHPLGGAVQAIIVDMHGEATSEKMAFGHFLDGRVSLVVGTHTHVPTADTMVLVGGTAYQTDAGMCGDYDSVIGFEKAAPIARFVKKMPGERLTPASGEGTVCGVVADLDPTTGLATGAWAVRVGGRLAQSLPPDPPPDPSLGREG